MRMISKLIPSSKWKLIIAGISLVALMVFSGLAIVEAQGLSVRVTEDGEQQTVNTRADTVGELLEAEDITVGEHDELSHTPETALSDGMNIALNHAKRVTVSIDDNRREFFTTEDTIGNFFDEEDLTFSKHDDLSFDLEDPVEDGMELAVEKGFQITVNDGGNKKKYWATDGSVEDLLEEQDITYDKDSNDKIKPKLNEQVSDDTTITITRIDMLPDEVVEETIPYNTKKQKDDTLAKGEEKVLEEGKEGKEEKTYEVMEKNGAKERNLIDTTVTEESENRVVAVGTKESKQSKPGAGQKPKKNSETSKPETGQKPKKDSESSKQDSVKSKAKSKSDNAADKGDGKELNMEATAYTANCSGCSGTTATGMDLNANPDANVIAVDPSVIPLGSKVWVEGYGNAIAADTGGFSGNRIDLHVATKGEASSFGRQNVKVKIID